MASKKSTAVVSVSSAEIAKAESNIENIASPLERAARAVAKVSSDETFAQAIAVRKSLKQGLAALEADKVEIISPLRGVLDKLYERYRACRVPLENHDSRIKGLIDAYAERERAKLVVKAEKQAEKAPSKEMGRDFIAKAERSDPVPAIAGVSFKEVWDYEVTDLALVPAHLNFGGADVEIRPIARAEVLKVVRFLKDKCEIPGLKIVMRRESSVRASGDAL